MKIFSPHTSPYSTPKLNPCLNFKIYSPLLTSFSGIMREVAYRTYHLDSLPNNPSILIRSAEQLDTVGLRMWEGCS